MRPFFINGNLCVEEDNIMDLQALMYATGNNTANGYNTYSILKVTLDAFSANSFEQIYNAYMYDPNRLERDIDRINNHCTHVFLNLTDFIRKSGEEMNGPAFYPSMKYLIKKINKPVIVAGLGINAEKMDPNFSTLLSSEMVDFLRVISEHCIEIGVAGYYTQETLKNLGITNTRVIGCPSFFEHGPERLLKNTSKRFGRIKQADILTHGTYFLPHYFPLKGNHEVLSDIRESKLIDAFVFGQYSGDFNHDECRKLQTNKYHVFSNIDEWKKFVSQFDFCIGGGLYAAILSINADVPTLLCNGDVATMETCEYLGIPHRACPSTFRDIEILFNEYDADLINRNYPVLFDEYTAFLDKNNVNTQYNASPKVSECLTQPTLNTNVKNTEERCAELLFFTMQSLSEKVTAPLEALKDTPENRIQELEIAKNKAEIRVQSLETQLATSEQRVKNLCASRWRKLGQLLGICKTLPFEKQ